MVHRKKSVEKVAPAAATPAARIRAWAKAQGLACPERGRIPSKLLELYASDDRSAAVKEEAAREKSEIQDDPRFKPHGKRHETTC